MGTDVAWVRDLTEQINALDVRYKDTVEKAEDIGPI